MAEQNGIDMQQGDTDRKDLPVWGPWQTTGLGFAIFIINIFTQTGVFIALAFREYALNPVPGVLEMLTSLATNGSLVSVAVIASSAVGVAMVIVFIKARRRVSIMEYLSLKPMTRGQIGVSLAVVAGLLAVAELANTVMGQNPDTGFNFQIYRTADPLALLWIAAVVFAPWFEEFFFRGFLFAGWLRSRLGPVGTVAITSALWAALHIQYSVYGMVQILIIGIVLGIMRLRTKSLWSPLLMHFAWNLTGMIAFAAG